MRRDTAPSDPLTPLPNATSYKEVFTKLSSSHRLTGRVRNQGQDGTSKDNTNQFAPLLHILADDGPPGLPREALNI